MTALEWALEFLRTETPEAERAVVDRIFAAGAEAQRSSDWSAHGISGSRHTVGTCRDRIRDNPLVTLPKGEG